MAWDKLAQICSEHLSKGRLVFIEGRIHSRSWESNGQKQFKTEIVAADMLILNSRQPSEALEPATVQPQSRTPRSSTPEVAARPAANSRVRAGATATIDDTDPDELPF